MRFIIELSARCYVCIIIDIVLLYTYDLNVFFLTHYFLQFFVYDQIIAV